MLHMFRRLSHANFYLQMVMMNPFILSGIEIQTYEMCKIAVYLNPVAIQYVKYQTRKLCKHAIYHIPHLIMYVKHQTYQLCKIALNRRQNVSLCHIKIRNKKIYLRAIDNDSSIFRVIEKSQLTERICKRAIKKRAENIKYISNPSKKLCEYALAKNPLSIQYMKQTTDLCLKAIEIYSRINNPRIMIGGFIHITNPYILESIYYQPLVVQMAAIKQDANNIKHIKHPTFKIIVYTITVNPLLLANHTIKQTKQLRKIAISINQYVHVWLNNLSNHLKHQIQSVENVKYFNTPECHM
jgi:hypothetical protein